MSTVTAKTKRPPYQVYRYLVHENGRESDECVESNHPRTQFSSRPVVQDEYDGRRYLVFGSRSDLWQYAESLPQHTRCLHEVIPGQCPQRLKLDIDVPAFKLDAISMDTLRACLGTEHAAALAVGGVDPEIENFIDEIFESSEDESADQAPAEAEPAEVVLHRERGQKMEAILEYILDKLVDELFMTYYAVEDVSATRQDLIVAESSGRAKEGWKFSYHVIVAPYAVADNEEARGFTQSFLEGIPKPIQDLIDKSVNKRLQNFRMTLSSKPGAARFKTVKAETAERLGTMAVTPDETLIIAPPGMRVLPRVFNLEASDEKRPLTVANMTEADLQSVLKVAESATVGHEMRAVKGTLILFERTAPTFCSICGEMHHKDNTLMLSVEPVEAGHTGPWPGREPVPHRVVEHCRHNPGHGVAIGEVSLGLADHNRATRITQRGRQAGAAADAAAGGGRVGARIAAIRAGRVNPHDASATLFEQLPEVQKTLYTASQMQAYELVPTLAVKAQMKLGKTRALRAYLDSFFPVDGLRQAVIRFVTFRQTFSNSLKEQFPDFTLYNDQKGDLDHVRFPRLIVQVESLHRLPMPSNPEPIDLLVLDEVESILAQFNSGLHRHFNAAFAMFQWQLRTARHVVCMDANLCDRSYRTLARMRPDYPIHFHWNRFERAAEDKYHFTDKQADWLGELHSAVGKNKTVVLVSNSLAEAKAFLEVLKRDFPLKKMALYSSEMSAPEKARHFANVHEYWAQLDVLIYTPTVSAGVSFELEHFDVLFGYFTDMSCDVETCRQMLARVRNLRSKEHFICLRGVPNNLPTSVDLIRKLVYDKRAGLYRNVEDSALQFSYTADGSIQYYESDYFYLWMETVRVENLSKNMFIERFIDQVSDTGAKIGVMAEGPATASALLVEHKRVKEDTKQARYEAVAGADDITAEEAAEIREDLIRLSQATTDDVKEVPDDRKFAYEKWSLREAYSWHGRPLDATFVRNYSDEAAKRVYRNLARITERETSHESLRAIGERESIHYRYMMSNRIEGKTYVNEGRDLQKDKRTYVFQSHFLAIWLLRLCGFICITDKSWINEAVLESRLRSALPAIEKAAPAISFEFSMRRPSISRLAAERDSRRFLSGVLALINGVLRMMYGIEVKRVAKRGGGKSFYVNQTATGALFVFSSEPESDDTPGGPKPHIDSQLAPIEMDTGIARFIEDEYAEKDSETDEESAPDPDDDAGVVFETGARAAVDLAKVLCTKKASTDPVEQMESFLDAVYMSGGGW